MQPTVTSGSPYVVPAGYHKIVKWSVQDGVWGNQRLGFKVFRPVGPAFTYRVVAHAGPHRLHKSSLSVPRIDTFRANIKVRPGDLIGVHTVTEHFKCDFLAQDTDYTRLGDLADGATGGPFGPDPGYRLNISAKVITGQRAAALKRCERKRGGARQKCLKRAQLLPL